MSKLPVRIDYNFDIDLDIIENLIPFVKTSLLIDTIPEEEIHLYSTSEEENVGNTYNYYDAWYVYGGNDLLYVGRRLLGSLISANYWRAKYIYSESARWTDAPLYQLKWILCDDSNYRIVTPSASSNSDYIIMPYSTITVKRNIGESLTTIQNINPSEDVPSNLTFPDLEQQQQNWLRDITNMEKVWIKINDNKYKLKVWGSISKLTNSEVGDIENYEKWNCVYVPYYYRTWDAEEGEWTYFSGYKLSSQSIVSASKDLYEGQATPNNLKLLVSYLNNKGYHETRKYKT